MVRVYGIVLSGKWDTWENIGRSAGKCSGEIPGKNLYKNGGNFTGDFPSIPGWIISKNDPERILDGILVWILRRLYERIFVGVGGMRMEFREEFL